MGTEVDILKADVKGLVAGCTAVRMDDTYMPSRNPFGLGLADVISYETCEMAA